MKHDNPLGWMMAIAIASMTVTACSLDSNEPEKTFIIDPVEQTRFFVCEASGETRSATAAIDTLFTEDDIEWFNVSTREIRFKQQDEELFSKLMKNYHRERLEFRLGESVLFEVSRFVSDFDSRIFYNLVLHYSTIGEDEGNPRYYLHGNSIIEPVRPSCYKRACEDHASISHSHPM